MTKIILEGGGKEFLTTEIMRMLIIKPNAGLAVISITFTFFLMRVFEK